MIPRTGKSFQLPRGAIYFDTGVIEVATPIVESSALLLSRDAFVLWEQIRYLRRELDHWARRHKYQCTLQGSARITIFRFQPRGNQKLRKREACVSAGTHFAGAGWILLQRTGRAAQSVCARAETGIEVTLISLRTPH